MGKIKNLRWASLICLVLLLIFRLLNMPPSAAEQLASYMGRQVMVLGDIEPLSVRSNGDFTSAVVRCRRLSVPAPKADKVQENVKQRLQGDSSMNIPQNYTGRLRVSVQETLPAAGSVEVAGMLEPLVGFRNPGCFDMQTYNRVQELGGRVSRAQVLDVQPKVLWWQRFALWNKNLAARIESVVGAERGALLAGMVLGGSSRLDEETRELFTDNGLAHLLSVSGTHLVLLTSLLSLLFSSVPWRWRRVLIIAFLVVYALLCGLRPPVLRALAMSSVLLFGGGGAERGRLLALLAAGLLCFKPVWLLDIGFQLSFAAAAGLIWLLSACQRVLPEIMPGLIREALAVTLAAQLAVVPLEIYYFHQISLVSLVSNIVLVPMLELAAQLALVGALLPVPGVYLLQGAGWLVAQVLVQAQFFAGLPYSVLAIGVLPAYCVVIYYALLALFADFAWLQFLCNAERKAAMFCCLLILGGTIGYQQQRTVPLACYFLDVGQDDCAVIVTPSQHIAFIDTGGLKNFSTGSRVLAPFLRSLGKREADVLLLSHYDFDHVGGAVDFLRQVRVKNLLLPNEKLTDESAALQRKILAQAKAQGTQVRVVHSGEQYVLDAGVALELVDVPQQAVCGNEASTLAALVSERGRVLFTGDMGEARERGMQLLHYDVLKAGHHGSRYSSSAEFLQQVQPQFTVLSCGRGNRYGHPHEETLERLQAVGSQNLRTDELGCVKVVFDEEGIKCYSYVYNKKAF